MKRFVSLFAFFFTMAVTASAQQKYSTYYYQRATLFEVLPTSQADIVFLGNSITDGGEWAELFQDARMKNRGISGDIAEGVFDRLDPIVKGKPAKIFLMIGINDVSRGTSADTIAWRVAKIVEKIQRETPSTRLYLESMLPVSDVFGRFEGHTSRGGVVVEANRLIRALAEEKGVAYVDLYSRFVDVETGRLNSSITNDGLHLLGTGYQLWKEVVMPYVNE